MNGTVKQVARSTANSPALRFLARVGFAVNGLLHALIGFIAIGVALGAGSGEADQSGALSALAATPGGMFLLWVVVVGLAALGLWLILGSFATTRGGAPKRGLRIVSEIGKGLVYLALAVTAFTFARGGSTNSAQASVQISASLLSTPGGVFVVAVIGLLIIGIGGYFIFKGATRRFTRDLNLPRGQAGSATKALGVFGYVAKGVVLVVVGILFLVAAATTNPGQSSGLDGGLKALVGLPFGPVILIVIAIGLIAYAIYSFVRARYARL
ncbi:MAG: DUF1206 domain-containing protein [Pseudolysinimonas sp.]